MAGQGEFEVKFSEICIVHYLLKNKMKSPVALNISITQILVYDTIYPIKGTRTDSRTRAGNVQDKSVSVSINV